MVTVSSIIEERACQAVSDAIAQAYPDHPSLPEEWFMMTTPPRADLGDFAVKFFAVAQTLGLPPAEVAEKILQHIKPVVGIIRWQQFGPYLNLFLDRGDYIKDACQTVLLAGAQYGQNQDLADEVVMVEFSSPNTNKPQHLGHVRNNVLGDIVANLIIASGARVIRANLVNDRGIHICKTMLAYEKWGNGIIPEQAGIKGDHYVGDLYVRFEKAFADEFAAWITDHPLPDNTPKQEEALKEAKEAFSREDSQLYREAYDLLQKWENGDPSVRELWAIMNKWVMDGFRQTYEALGISFDKYYFESQTYGLGRDIIDQGLNDGLFIKDERGAVVADLTTEKLGLKIMLRPDGTSVYITQDLGTAVMKQQDWDLTRSIYVVAQEQEYHFKVLFTILKRLGYEWASELYHLSYGMVHLPSGRMKSREGTVVDADDLIKELIAAAAKEISKRADDPAKAADHEERARQVALGALKFALVLPSPRSDMLFNPKESISFEGKTGPYIQYTHARISSIERRAGEVAVDPQAALALDSEEEFAVAHILHYYPSVVREAALAYNPSLLANYLWEIAKTFNQFYHSHHVLKAKSQKQREGRLMLCQATRQVLNEGLKLLGIEAPTHM